MFLNETTRLVEEGKAADDCYLGYSKAFDLAGHILLPNKMPTFSFFESVGFSATVTACFRVAAVTPDQKMSRARHFRSLSLDNFCAIYL